MNRNYKNFSVSTIEFSSRHRVTENQLRESSFFPCAGIFAKLILTTIERICHLASYLIIAISYRYVSKLGCKKIPLCTKDGHVNSISDDKKRAGQPLVKIATEILVNVTGTNLLT